MGALGVVRYVTHPQVRISAEIPVPRWGLSDVGRTRAEQLCARPWLAGVGRLVSSGETKALETAAIVAVATGLAVEVREALHENDRSSTGFVPGERFDALADAFFASPEVSVEGWETSADAQRRVVAETADLFGSSASVVGPDVLIVGHGATGTLLLCHLLGVPISRAYDQSTGGEAAPGGGNVWAYDLDRRQVRHPWRAMEHS